MKVDPTVIMAAKMKQKRELRRQNAEKFRIERDKERRRNEAKGTPGDVDYQRLIKEFRLKNVKHAHPHSVKKHLRTTVCVRKRPVNKREVSKKDWDSISCLNPVTYVHACKTKVDGITKFLDNTEFVFDHSFDESASNNVVYNASTKLLVKKLFDGESGTVFAYGQTGSGKTYTMTGLQERAANDIFKYLNSSLDRNAFTVAVSFFEIFSGRCQDLLHNREKITIMEDGAGQVQMVGLETVSVTNGEDLLYAIKKGNAIRTTHATEMNEQSSRSHAVCEITIKKHGRFLSKFTLIDLAGSERGCDTKSHNRQRRIESAEINKSLLALKECLRAMTNDNIMHVPFRASKLTLVLKECFTSTRSRVVMIANVAPTASVVDHTLNTLRYSHRIKEHPSAEKVKQKNFSYVEDSDSSDSSDSEEGAVKISPTRVPTSPVPSSQSHHPTGPSKIAVVPPPAPNSNINNNDARGKIPMSIPVPDQTAFSPKRQRRSLDKHNMNIPMTPPPPVLSVNIPSNGSSYGDNSNNGSNGSMRSNVRRPAVLMSPAAKRLHEQHARLRRPRTAAVTPSHKLIPMMPSQNTRSPSPPARNSGAGSNTLGREWNVRQVGLAQRYQSSKESFLNPQSSRQSHILSHAAANHLSLADLPRPKEYLVSQHGSKTSRLGPRVDHFDDISPLIPSKPSLPSGQSFNKPAPHRTRSTREQQQQQVQVSEPQGIISPKRGAGVRGRVNFGEVEEIESGKQHQQQYHHQYQQQQYQQQSYFEQQQELQKKQQQQQPKRRKVPGGVGMKRKGSISQEADLRSLYRSDNPDVLKQQEVVDRLLHAQNELLQNHAGIMKEESKLKEKEQDIFNWISDPDNIDGDVKNYIDTMEQVLDRRLEMFSEMKYKISRLRSHLATEEKLSRNLPN